MKRIVLLALALAAASGQTNVRREGGYWVATSNGSLALPSSGRLKVITSGSIVAQGGAQDGCSYALKKRVKARSEADARRLLERYAVKTRTAGDWTYLILAGGENAELFLRAPRALRQVVFETQGGNVEAYDLDGAVETETRGGRIQLDRLGGAATARTGGGEVVLGRVRGTVRCLSGGGSIRVDSVGGEAWFETAGGEIWAREALGPVRASTNGGNIHIGRAESTVSAHTKGGLIDVQQAGGAVTAETAGGSIQVGAARGVRCESAAGAIKLRNVTGMLRASTAVGNILAELLGPSQGATPLEESFLTTGAGDIIVYIPSNLAVTIRVQNESGFYGRIVSDFPEIRMLGERRPVVAEGALNGGGPLLRLSVANGTIYLRRQK